MCISGLPNKPAGIVPIKHEIAIAEKINKPNRKALPSVGTQLVYKPNDRNTINLSTYIGDEPINDLLRTRYFNNFYWNYQWNSKWRTILGFDFGFQKQLTESYFDNWYSRVLMI